MSTRSRPSARSLTIPQRATFAKGSVRAQREPGNVFRVDRKQQQQKPLGARRDQLLAHRQGTRVHHPSGKVSNRAEAKKREEHRPTGRCLLSKEPHTHKRAHHTTANGRPRRGLRPYALIVAVYCCLSGIERHRRVGLSLAALRCCCCCCCSVRRFAAAACVNFAARRHSPAQISVRCTRPPTWFLPSAVRGPQKRLRWRRPP